MNLGPEDAKRFWDKVDKSSNCWLWTSTTRTGYGIFRLKGKMWSAHRLSHAMHNGPVEGFQVRHTCDNPPCVNPSHLILGNAKANSDDKMDRDRHHFPLSNEQVSDIRSRPLSITMCRDLAQEFNVSVSAIRRVLEGKTYQWLPGARVLPAQFTGYKLTHEQVVEIADALKSAKYGSIKKLSEKYGVDRQTIAGIKYRRRHYTDTL